MSVYSIEKLMAETRRLAVEYRRATGKTLPVTVEIAIHDAIHLLQLEPAPQDAAGYDAVDRRDGEPKRIQIKGRAVFDEARGGHRLGQLKTEQAWDAIALVLMDEYYEAQEIYEAERADILEALSDLKRSERPKRGALSVARFKIIGKLVWSRERGLEDDGYWTNRPPR